MENEKVIKTINNIDASESNCRFLDGQYYLIGDTKKENSGDIYLIGKRYIRPENLIYNHTRKEYVIPTNDLIQGVVSFKGEEPILGYFEKNKLYNVSLFNPKEEYFLCLNKDIIPLCFREEVSTGVYFHISTKRTRLLNLIKEVPREIKESYPYDSRGITDKATDVFNKNYKPIITESVKKYSPLLKDYSFGFEFETVRGFIPSDKLKVLPLIPLRDGSITGLEYVTIPLKKDIGLQALIDSTDELKNRTEFDTTCALHAHIGGIPRTPEFILAFYKVISHFQEETFAMFPLYKKYNFGVKRKNYSKPFPFNKINSLLDASIDVNNKEQIIKNFDIIFTYLSEGHPFVNYDNSLENVKEHPRDPNGNQKWNINTRYYAVNFIPLIFGNKQTVEFRIHTPTYDIHKIINFLLINIYLIDFTINNIDSILKDPSKILKYDLRYFVESYVSSQKINLKRTEMLDLIDYHNDYITNRLHGVEQCNSKGDIEGDEENILCNKYINWNSVDSNKTNLNVYFKGERRSYKPSEVKFKEERSIKPSSNPLSEAMNRLQKQYFSTSITSKAVVSEKNNKRVSIVKPVKPALKTKSSDEKINAGTNPFKDVITPFYTEDDLIFLKKLNETENPKIVDDSIRSIPPKISEELYNWSMLGTKENT